jgi:hypothetical protein
MTLHRLSARLDEIMLGMMPLRGETLMRHRRVAELVKHHGDRARFYPKAEGGAIAGLMKPLRVSDHKTQDAINDQANRISSKINARLMGQNDNTEWKKLRGRYQVVNAVHDYNRLNAKLDEIRFSILGVAGIGAGIHVAQNAITKKLLNSTKGNRILSSIFKAGRRHAAEGKEIHPAFKHISNVGLGPEYSELYDAGRKSHNITKADLPNLSKRLGGEAKSTHNIINGPSSKHADWVLNKMHKVKQGASKWTGRLIGAGAGVASAMVEPVLPAINATRTLVARSKLGRSITERVARAGIEGKRAAGWVRNAADYVVSPALSHIQNTAYNASKAVKNSVKSFIA